MTFIYVNSQCQKCVLPYKALSVHCFFGRAHKTQSISYSLREVGHNQSGNVSPLIGIWYGTTYYNDWNLVRSNSVKPTMQLKTNLFRIRYDVWSYILNRQLSIFLRYDRKKILSCRYKTSIQQPTDFVILRHLRIWSESVKLILKIKNDI